MYHIPLYVNIIIRQTDFTLIERRFLPVDDEDHNLHTPFQGPSPETCTEFIKSYLIFCLPLVIKNLYTQSKDSTFV